MIADPRVFDDEFVPPDLLHRENEIEQLLRRFTTRHPAESDVLISGPSGVGKTVLARTAVDHLETQTDVTRVFVDSLGKTTGGVLRATLEQLPRGPDDVAQTLPTQDVCREIREAITGETIVVLDEGDDLPQTNVVDELADILKRRARQGFHGEPVSRAQLEAIANEVAGVARYGIQSLRSAAILAHERGHRRIRDRDVDDAYEHARHRMRKLSLSSLPFHHQVLYAIVHEAEELPASELHDRYDAVSEELYAGSPTQPLGERARRGKLSKLAEYDLIDYDGPTRDRLYWVLDEDVEPRVELPEPGTFQ